MAELSKPGGARILPAGLLSGHECLPSLSTDDPSQFTLHHWLTADKPRDVDQEDSDEGDVSISDWEGSADGEDLTDKVSGLQVKP